MMNNGLVYACDLRGTEHGVTHWKGKRGVSSFCICIYFETEQIVTPIGFGPVGFERRDPEFRSAVTFIFINVRALFLFLWNLEIG